MQKYFEVLNIPWITKTQFYGLQKTIFSVSNEAWKKQQDGLPSFIVDSPLSLSGDGRCDSPGLNTKYLTYSVFDQNVGKVIALSLTEVTDVGGCANRMENVGLIKVLDELYQKDAKVAQFTTDRHIQIRKFLREQRPEINYQFDVWHFSKSVKTKLLNVAKKESCEKLKSWIKSIINHLWWSCATCNENEKLLKVIWVSVIFIQNKHRTGHELYHECSHPQLIQEREWLVPYSTAFTELQSIVF